MQKEFRMTSPPSNLPNEEQKGCPVTSSPSDRPNEQWPTDYRPLSVFVDTVEAPLVMGRSWLTEEWQTYGQPLNVFVDTAEAPFVMGRAWLGVVMDACGISIHGMPSSKELPKDP